MNAEDAIIAKKRKRVERMMPILHDTLNKVLVQRRDEQKIRRIEIIERQAPQQEIRIIHP